MSEIELQGVTRRYGARTALGPIALRVASGERVVLIGPSGSGKSTLLGVIAASISVSEGEVRIDDRDIGHASPRELSRYRRGLGFVPQVSAITLQLSVHRNVLAGALPGWAWPRVLLSAVWPLERERVRAALEQVGLADRQWDGAGQLSGGEAQRVGVARALLSEPRMVLADEPTASLDPVNAAMVTELLVEDSRRRGVTLLFSTHWVSLITARFDRVVGLREGRIVLDVPAAKVDQDALDALYAGSDERR